MQTSITLYSGILLLGAAHGAFLTLALLNVRSGNTIALRLLALLTLTFAVDLFINFLSASGYLVIHPRLVFIESAGMFLYGPFVYFYVLAMTSREQWHFSAAHYLHFLPFILAIALLLPFYNLSDERLVDMIYAGANGDQDLDPWALGGLLVNVLPRLLIGIYLALGVLRLVQHGHNIREQFSLIEGISLNWLRNLLIAIGALYVMYFIALAFGGKGPVENVLNIAMVVVVYTLGYMGLRQPAIFTQRDEPPSDGAKYQKSALDDESSKMLLSELQQLMATERPYLDSKLSLAQLAEKLRISSNYLSQIINQQTGSNFFDYINGHRVEMAKQILSDPSRARVGVLTIAMDSGFNSKSAFYTAFKHHAGLTPTQYRREKLS